MYYESTFADRNFDVVMRDFSRMRSNVRKLNAATFATARLRDVSPGKHWDAPRAAWANFVSLWKQHSSCPLRPW